MRADQRREQACGCHQRGAPEQTLPVGDVSERHDRVRHVLHHRHPLQQQLTTHRPHGLALLPAALRKALLDGRFDPRHLFQLNRDGADGAQQLGPGAEALEAREEVRGQEPRLSEPDELLEEVGDALAAAREDGEDRGRVRVGAEGVEDEVDVLQVLGSR